MAKSRGRAPGGIGREPPNPGGSSSDSSGFGGFRTPGPLRAKEGANSKSDDESELPALIPKVSIEQLSRGTQLAALPDSVPFKASREITIKVEPSLFGTGLTLEVFVVNAGGTNGAATVTPDSITRTTKVKVTGTAQSAPGSGGKLQLMVRLAGTGVAVRSQPFSVCAHPSGLREQFFKDLDDPKDLKFGVICQVFINSDSGSPNDLDQVVVSEIVEQIRHDEPPFKRGSGQFSGAGSAGGNVTDLQFESAITPAGKARGDFHAEPRPDAGPEGTAEYLQLHVFKCARCGSAVTALPKSGYDIEYKVKGSGNSFRYEIKKVGADISTKFGGVVFRSSAGEAGKINVTHSLP